MVFRALVNSTGGRRRGIDIGDLRQFVGSFSRRFRSVYQQPNRLLITDNTYLLSQKKKKNKIHKLKSVRCERTQVTAVKCKQLLYLIF